MSDPTQLAKSARELLASALNALQSNAEVPEDLMAVAEPIAEAMGLLHKIERSNGADLEGREEALKYVRGALDLLQKVEQQHPALDIVMEAVATSLSKVHALTRVPKPSAAPVAAPVAAAPVQAAPVQAAPVQAAPAPRAAPPAPIDIAPPPMAVFDKALGTEPTAAFPSPGGPRGTLAMQPSPVAHLAQQQQQQASNPAQPIKTPFTALPVQAYVQQAQAQAHQAHPQAAPQPSHAPQPPAPQPVPAQAPQAAPQPAPQPSHLPAPTPVMPQPQAQAQAASRAPAPPSAKPAPVPGSIDVELGTHSTSNFYKGLGGNDVIDHGGLFVATYKIPKMGATVTLRVLLPGDLEFSAKAVVQWTREAAGSSEPGYGARFTQITQEGRHLVYRYTRNREPMFYDDL